MTVREVCLGSKCGEGEELEERDRYSVARGAHRKDPLAAQHSWHSWLRALELASGAPQPSCAPGLLAGCRPSPSHLPAEAALSYSPARQERMRPAAWTRCRVPAQAPAQALVHASAAQRRRRRQRRGCPATPPVRPRRGPATQTLCLRAACVKRDPAVDRSRPAPFAGFLGLCTRKRRCRATGKGPRPRQEYVRQRGNFDSAAEDVARPRAFQLETAVIISGTSCRFRPARSASAAP